MMNATNASSGNMMSGLTNTAKAPQMDNMASDKMHPMNPPQMGGMMSDNMMNAALRKLGIAHPTSHSKRLTTRRCA